MLRVRDPVTADSRTGTVVHVSAPGRGTSNREDHYVFTWKKAGAAAFAGAIGVGMTLAGAGMAGATTVVDFPDLPGGGGGNTNYIVGSPDITVTVTDVDLTTGAVSGTIENNTGADLNCAVKGGLQSTVIDGVVTEPGIISQALDVYAGTVGLPGAIGGLLPAGLLDTSGSLGSLMGLAGMTPNTIPAQADQARIRGHLGVIDAGALNAIADGTTANWTSQLSPRSPDNGVRDEFDATAMFLCADPDPNAVPNPTSSNYYVAAGNADGDAPAAGEDAGTGSLGSLTGSLGSLTGSSGS